VHHRRDPQKLPNHGLVTFVPTPTDFSRVNRNDSASTTTQRV